MKKIALVLGFLVSAPAWAQEGSADSAEDTVAEPASPVAGPWGTAKRPVAGSSTTTVEGGPKS